MLGFGRDRGELGPAPLDAARLVLSDLDGVVYQGPGAIAGAVDALNGAAASGRRVAYLTNNASRTDEQVAAHLRELGLAAQAQDVVTSPQAALTLLRERVAPGALVLVVGGDGIVQVLEDAGYRTTRSADDLPDAVMQGFAPHVGWEHLAEAAFALARDIPWIATNQDWTIPVARGVAPGNGTLVSAVHTAVGKLATVAGKPETPMFELALERFGATAAESLMLGDRLDTDILGANRAGIPSVLVLTGIDRPKQILAAAGDQRPTFILEHLGQLTEPYPVVRVEQTEPDAWLASCGGEQVSLRGVDVRRESKGRSRIDVLRAASAVIAASGKMIFALRVPASLHEDWLRA